VKQWDAVEEPAFISVSAQETAQRWGLRHAGSSVQARTSTAWLYRLGTLPMKVHQHLAINDRHQQQHNAWHSSEQADVPDFKPHKYKHSQSKCGRRLPDQPQRTVRPIK